MQREGAVGGVLPDEGLVDGRVPVGCAVALISAGILDVAAGGDGAVGRGKPVQTALWGVGEGEGCFGGPVGALEHGQGRVVDRGL